MAFNFFDQDCKGYINSKDLERFAYQIGDDGSLSKEINMKMIQYFENSSCKNQKSDNDSSLGELNISVQNVNDNSKIPNGINALQFDKIKKERTKIGDRYIYSTYTGINPIPLKKNNMEKSSIKTDNKSMMSSYLKKIKNQLNKRFRDFDNLDISAKVYINGNLQGLYEGHILKDIQMQSNLVKSLINILLEKIHCIKDIIMEYENARQIFQSLTIQKRTEFNMKIEQTIIAIEYLGYQFLKEKELQQQNNIVKNPQEEDSRKLNYQEIQGNMKRERIHDLASKYIPKNKTSIGFAKIYNQDKQMQEDIELIRMTYNNESKSQNLVDNRKKLKLQNMNSIFGSAQIQNALKIGKQIGVKNIPIDILRNI
ncbi:hypothetical protein PPERSA_04765 [Pseudocohnilembus persalinus]|uniref:EF-hand domain-containing protein n=1 Tax=Pseudocohnilembus persalinus TaxID=266149 RepID=A0A0V0QNJ5_PSEPJ|nr:hypothetical protein PPERSA_04765 [Pseudocohnilembus persalinus]|eukprot:KRX03887.1 hypothetical protein PPERSA_04765 [Pseudocohnilembus persalinus]